MKKAIGDTDVAESLRRCADAQEQVVQLLTQFVNIVAVRTEHRLGVQAQMVRSPRPKRLAKTG